jgi:hypothetical protein
MGTTEERCGVDGKEEKWILVIGERGAKRS